MSSSKPTRYGYKFAGWYYNDKTVTSVSEIISLLTDTDKKDKNIELVAKWIGSEYKISNTTKTTPFEINEEYVIIDLN